MRVVPVMLHLAAEQLSHPGRYRHTEVELVLLQTNCHVSVGNLWSRLWIRCQFKGLSMCVVARGTLSSLGVTASSSGWGTKGKIFWWVPQACESAEVRCTTTRVQHPLLSCSPPVEGHCFTRRSCCLCSRAHSAPPPPLPTDACEWDRGAQWVWERAPRCFSLTLLLLGKG